MTNHSFRLTYQNLLLLLLILFFSPHNIFAQEEKIEKMEIAVVLFDNYETLDVYGPVEIFGRLVDKYEIKFYSLGGGVVKNKHGVAVLTEKLEDSTIASEILFIPGGMGTRLEVDNKPLIDRLAELSIASQYTLTVCTGSALLAKTGLLDGKQATTNKRAFSWVESNGLDVLWDRKARWKVDGKFYTSSGVSAGMDMSLGFLADRHGVDFARKVATEIEYNWIEDMDNDTFIAK